jgi:hypothetical protein
MTAINDEIAESMRIAAEQQALKTGEEIENAISQEELEVFRKARESQEAEAAGLPEKYQGKTAAEVYALMQREQAYRESQGKDGSKPPEDGQEGPSEEPEGETPEEEESEVSKALQEASEEFYSNEGKLKDETIAKLSELPSAELIKAWQELQSKAPVEPPLTEADTAEILKDVGGQEAYNETLQWAAENLSEADRAAYDKVIQSGSKAATKFAVEALVQRYRAAVGFDGEQVSGRNAKPAGVKPYRSNAELRRDLANPLYQNDPAFRLDVETRLAASGELLD